MISRIKKALDIDHEDIIMSHVDEELILYEVKGSQKEPYPVSCNHDDLWRCTCCDFGVRGINKAEGSFLCKHIIGVLLLIANEEAL